MKSATEEHTNPEDASKPSTRVNLTLRARLQQLGKVLQQSQNDTLASTVRNLIQHSGIYALSSLALPLVTLVLAPFLTHTLSRTDYGVLAVLTTTITLMVGLTQLGLSSAFFRAYNYDYEDLKDKRAVLATVSTILLASSLCVVLLILITAPWISLLLFGSAIYSVPVQLAALAILSQNLTVPGLSWLRAESKAWPYSILSIVNLLVNLAVTVLCVGPLHMGIIGALLAIVAGYAVIAGWTFPMALWRAGLRLRIDIAHNLFSFGLPLVSNTVSLWVLQLSDRYLLGRLGSLAETASYTVAYTLGGVLGVVVLAPFSLAWPTAMYAIAKRVDATSIFRLVFRWYSLFLLFATASLAIVAIEVLYLFFPPAYDSALPVIPLIAISIMCFGIYSYFTIGISLQRKTWLAVLLTSIAALVNVGLNLLLIPRLGALGAALATLLAYALLALSGYIVNQRLYPVKFAPGSFLLALGSGIVLFTACAVLIQWQQLANWEGLLFYIGSLCLYTVFLILYGKRTSKDHKMIPYS